MMDDGVYDSPTLQPIVAVVRHWGGFVDILWWMRWQ
jgi:hypothetical protein